MFLLQDIDDMKNSKNETCDVSYLEHIDVQIGQYSNDTEDLDKVEEGIDANEYLSEKERSPNYTSTSHISDYPTQNSSMDCDNCDTNENSILISEPVNQRLDRTRSIEGSLNHTVAISSQFPSNGVFITSSSYPTIKNSSYSSSGQNIQSLPSGLDRRQAELSFHNSTSSSLSSQSPQQSQFTNSTATTVDEQNCLMTPFIFPNTEPTNSYVASRLPILATNSGPSSSTATNLLLPPIWIPDEMVTTCKICEQLFNIIRRRHHCRRCGQIFCHQCSNNFVSLKCFGYAKPVRVCNSCLVLHNQSINNHHVSSTSPFGAS